MDISLSSILEDRSQVKQTKASQVHMLTDILVPVGRKALEFHFTWGPLPLWYRQFPVIWVAKGKGHPQASQKEEIQMHQRPKRLQAACLFSSARPNVAG